MGGGVGVRDADGGGASGSSGNNNGGRSSGGVDTSGSFSAGNSSSPSASDVPHDDAAVATSIAVLASTPAMIKDIYTAVHAASAYRDVYGVFLTEQRA